MKHYPREYERVFTDKEKIDRVCKLEDVSFSGEYIKDATDYITMLRDTFSVAQDTIYELLVKYVWLSRHFCYKGYRREKLYGNGFIVDTAFGIFLRSYANLDARMFFGASMKSSFSRVITYFDDFYPDFDIHSPFVHAYKFPYKNITMEYLATVHVMDERLELLEHADKMDMKYTEFCDYVLNYINCYNDEHHHKYDWIFSSFNGVTKSERYKKWLTINKYEKRRKSKKYNQSKKAAEGVGRISEEEK